MLSKWKNLPPSVSVGFLIFIVALAIRCIGMSWGLPSSVRITSLHPDEPINWMVTRQAGDLTPNFYNYGTLFFTLQNIVLAPMHWLGLGVPDPSAGTVGGLSQEMWMGRLLSALFGSAMSWVTFAFLFKRSSLVGAGFGAAVVAFAPGLVVHSRFMTVDVMASFFVLMALFWACEAIDRQDMRSYVLTGVFAGLAAGCKYNGVLAGFALLPAFFQAPKEARWKMFGSAIGTCILVFLVCVPGVILESAAFMRDFQYEMWHVSTGHGMVFAGTADGPGYHLFNLVMALGLFLALTGLAGLGRLLQNKTTWAVSLVIFAAIYFVLIARAEVKFLRYVLPLIPIFAIGAGWLVGRMHEKAGKWKAGVAFALFALAGLPQGGLRDASIYTFFMTDADPRDSAAAFLKGKESVGLVSDPWFSTPALYPEVPAPRPVPFAQREQWRLAQTQPRVLRFVPPNADQRVDWDPRLLSELKPQYVVISSFDYEGYTRFDGAKSIPPAYQSQVANFRSFREALLKQYALDRTFGGGMIDVHDLMYIRPKMDIWKRKEPLNLPSTNSSTTSRPSEVPASTP